ncbi:MAG TPA: FAD-binding protein, partial [Thermoguttaceae bacterium]
MHHSPLVKDLCSALGGENVISAPSELQVYDCDAFTLKRNSPEVVVFPRSTEQVAAIMKISNQHSASIVPRGSGTGITGGCLPTPRSIVVVLTRLNRLLELNLRDRLAVVEAGATHCQLSKALAGSGYFYAPQSSGHGAGTIGGSVAANAGGPLSLKFGVTVNHILGLEAVLGDGSIVQLGPVHDPASFDLIGLLAGSEGTLGIITKAWLRLTPTAQDHRTIPAVFDSIDDAVSVVTQIIAAGMMPTATELIDQTILPLFNTELTSGIPPDAASVLLIQIEGTAATIDRQQERIAALCKQNNARAVLQTSPAHKDETAYKHRKSPLGAVGRLSPDYFIEDVAVPRAKLPSMLRIIAEIGQKHQLQIGNLAHLGDGTVESVILFDQRDSSTVDRALAAGNELLDHCIALG